MFALVCSRATRTRRLAPAVAGAIALLGGFLPGCSKDTPPRRPNVVLIVVDTLRADRMSSYGYGRQTTPRLDELAREGTLFDDVTAQASWTLPSMVSLLTGRYNTTARSDISESIPTVAQSFRRSGYTTLGLVANPSMTRNAGFSRGFDLYIKDDRRARPDGDMTGTPPPRTTPPIDEIADIGVLESIEDALWDALERVQGFGEQGDAPLFLYLHPFDPHKPYSEHPRYDAALPIAGAEGAPPLALGAWHAERLRQEGPPAPRHDPDWSQALAAIAAERAAYDQEVRYTDDALGRILDGLRERGLLDDAIVVLASDHGEGLWDHLSGRPLEEATSPQLFFYQEHGGHLYQEATRTPLLFWGSGVPEGTRVAEAVENVDLVPTLFELAQIPVRSELHGTSLVDLMHGRAASPHELVITNAQHKATVRDPATGLKLTVVHDNPRARHHKPELYDLANDPLERNDLLAQRPDDAARLRQGFEAWVTAHPDPDSDSDGGGGGVRDAEQQAILNELGYTGFDIGDGD